MVSLMQPQWSIDPDNLMISSKTVKNKAVNNSQLKTKQNTDVCKRGVAHGTTTKFLPTTVISFEFYDWGSYHYMQDLTFVCLLTPTTKSGASIPFKDISIKP